MDLFVEKEFIEDFEIEYLDTKYHTQIQDIIFRLFSEYTGIRLFINTSDEFVKSSTLLEYFTDNNQNLKFDVDFESVFNVDFVPHFQTIVFTLAKKEWFTLLKKKGVLCFTFENYHSEINYFITKTHFEIDLSDKDNLPFKWSTFSFFKDEFSKFIIISDPYILCDFDGQKIKNNLVKLLKENLNKNQLYSIFLITKVNNDIDKKVSLLNRELNGYNAKIFIFNVLPEFENIDLHDRILYTNYTITESGKGFNLNVSKLLNSEITSTSIFEKYTYKRFNNHIRELVKYVSKLENSPHLSNPYKANSAKAYNAFSQLIST